MVDVVAIGNALMDVLSHETDEFVTEQGMVKGTMDLIDTERARSLYAAMNPTGITKKSSSHSSGPASRPAVPRRSRRRHPRSVDVAAGAAACVVSMTYRRPGGRVRPPAPRSSTAGTRPGVGCTAPGWRSAAPASWNHRG